MATGRPGSSLRCCAHGPHWGPPLGPWPKLPQGGAAETPRGAPRVSHMPREPLRRAQWNWEAKPLAPSAPSAYRAEMVPAGGRLTREPRLGNGGWTWSREAGTRDLTLTCNQCG